MSETFKGIKKCIFKEIKKRIKFKIFPYDLVINISTDIHEAGIRHHKDLEKIPKHAVATHVSTGGGTSLIFLKYDANEGTIAHESHHAVQELMEYIGADYNNEVEAYLLTHIVQQIHDFRKKSWKNKKDLDK